MSQSVKVKIRPGSSLDFPAICVHCSLPASERMPLRKRRGRLTRLIDVPLCEQCAAELRRKSGEEERLDRIGRFVSALLTIVTVILAFALLPGGLPFLLRLFIALLVAAFAGLLALAYFRRRSLAAAHPEKLDILASARISHFTWRATTFYFDNDDFSRRFASMNNSRLMEVAGDSTTEG
jgi:hypothetical protein